MFQEFWWTTLAYFILAPRFEKVEKTWALIVHHHCPYKKLAMWQCGSLFHCQTHPYIIIIYIDQKNHFKFWSQSGLNLTATIFDVPFVPILSATGGSCPCNPCSWQKVRKTSLAVRLFQENLDITTGLLQPMIGKW